MFILASGGGRHNLYSVLFLIIMTQKKAGVETINENTNHEKRNSNSNSNSNSNIIHNHQRPVPKEFVLNLDRCAGSSNDEAASNKETGIETDREIAASWW